MKQVAALIIAAGSSSRLGQPKQLLMLNGETLLDRAIRTAREASAEPVLVVLGANHQEIEARVQFEGARMILNSRWEEGMASSIRAGVEWLRRNEPEVCGVLLMICDQPRVSTEHLVRMLDEFHRFETGTIASVYASKRGTPAIFPRKAFTDLLTLQGDRGARGMLSDPGREVIEIALEGGEIDIDRPEDLTALQ